MIAAAVPDTVVGLFFMFGAGGLAIAVLAVLLWSGEK